MSHSVKSILAGAAAVVLLCGAVPRAARAAEPVPELDVVARTAVRLHPDHTRMVQRKLVEYARECLAGLVSPDMPPQEGAPKDGAARFRLFIEHSATLKTAGALEKHDMLTRDGYYGQWLATKDQGAYKFRLAQWDKSHYVNVDQWTCPYAVVHRIDVWKKFTSRDMPVLRERALKNAFPEHVKQALLGRILPIRIVQSRGVVGATQSCRVIVKNASRWPLKSLKATLHWPDARSKGGARYKAAISGVAALEPGKQTVVSCMGEPVTRDFRWQYLEPMSIDASPVFAPAEP